MSWKVVTSVFLLGVMVHAYSPSIQEAEAERMLIWHQFGSSSETLFENKLNIHTVLLQLLLSIHSQMHMHTKHFLCHRLNKPTSFIIAYVSLCEKMCILDPFLSPVSKSVNDIYLQWKKFRQMWEWKFSLWIWSEAPGCPEKTRHSCYSLVFVSLGAAPYLLKWVCWSMSVSEGCPTELQFSLFELSRPALFTVYFNSLIKMSRIDKESTSITFDQMYESQVCNKWKFCFI